MKISPFIWRVLTFSVFVLAISVLVSMDLDTEDIRPITTQDSVNPEFSQLQDQVSPSIPSQDDSAEYVLNRYFKAMGGAQWSNIKTIHKTGLVSLKAGGSMALTYGKDMYQGIDGYLLEEIDVNDSRLSQVMQNGEVMTLVRNNIYPQSGLEALSFKEHLLPVGDLTKITPSKAQYMGKYLVEGKWVYKLFRGQQLGYDVHEYYSVSSHLKVMTSLGDDCQVRFKKYKSINGLRIPSLVETHFREFDRKLTYEVEQIAMNVAIPTSPIDLKTVSIESVASN
ncbi:hypothetical protein [Roseivirga sp. 4D4]|uniref:hypothetical protein n=1 Tax=Roseivirga sp. 4D4 TaxID=1889784 RepID=UPI001112D318|nr:hypothetical protein [Roseivirga sp. 4D4]